MVGIFVYYLEARKNKTENQNTLFIFLAAILGGVLGAKLPVWITHGKDIIVSFSNHTLIPETILSGRTVVGGMIGGTLAVWGVKKWLNINEKKGNLFAPALAIGLSIGRIGCFLRGCCYGVATKLSWGVDFGDGILRHPTELYEAMFFLTMFVYLINEREKNPPAGILFKRFITGYFIFRFFIEFIRVGNGAVFLGLTTVQLVAILIVILNFRTIVFNFLQKRKVSAYE